MLNQIMHIYIYENIVASVTDGKLPNFKFYLLRNGQRFFKNSKRRVETKAQKGLQGSLEKFQTTHFGVKRLKNHLKLLKKC